MRLGIAQGVQLRNSSNICYINATINLLLWMHQVHGSDQALGGLTRAMRGIKPRVNVNQCLGLASTAALAPILAQCS